MAETIRFPLLAPSQAGPAERDQVITLLAAVATIPRAGAAPYTDLTPWKIAANLGEAPFPCVVVEFEGNAAFTIGDGTVPIGLYGEIIDNGVSPATSFRTLLGILGININGTNVPQIPLDTTAAPLLVGFSQIVSNVACYDRLSVGGVGAAIALAEGNLVTVRVRPIHARNWVG